MSQKEKLYEEVKNRIIYLFHTNAISQLQCDYLLKQARIELGLLVANKSIYL